MGDRVADPKALGFAAFATMAWMYSMVGAGWVSASSAVAVLHQAATFSMLALLVAALAAFLRGEAWHAFFFMFWSALILGYRGVLATMAAMASPGAANGWYSLIIAVVSFLCTLAFAPHLDKGIMVGVVLSLALYLYRNSRPTIASLSRQSCSSVVCSSADKPLSDFHRVT